LDRANALLYWRRQYLSLNEIQDAGEVLNFDTPDCIVRGACEIYTTKAVRSDRKLYKTIASSLDSQHENILRISASLPPNTGDKVARSLDLSRSSPFGPLTRPENQKAFAYLVATLNASHPDYEFSHIPPSEFVRQPSLGTVTDHIDSTISNLRSRPAGDASDEDAAPVSSPGVSPASWTSNMWRIIDEQMTLDACSIYRWHPEDDPFQDEEGTIWTTHYFFFNKLRKRVCYLHVRGMSVMSHSPLAGPSLNARRGFMGAENARRRLRIGGRVAEEDDEDIIMVNPGDDMVDDFDALESSYAAGSISSSSSIASYDEFVEPSFQRKPHRSMSDHELESMEL